MGGYSGTPLGRKLGIRRGALVLPLNAPSEYPRWLGLLPADARVVRVSPKSGCDIAHLFVDSSAVTDVWSGLTLVVRKKLR